jgi:hypothetical protein
MAAAASDDSAEAASHIDAARTAVEAIAEGIADDELRNSFRKKWISDLASVTSELLS